VASDYLFKPSPEPRETDSRVDWVKPKRQRVLWQEDCPEDYFSSRPRLGRHKVPDVVHRQPVQVALFLETACRLQGTSTFCQKKIARSSCELIPPLIQIMSNAFTPLMAKPDSLVARRAPFALHQLWTTPYVEGQLFPCVHCPPPRAK
jgi:hypothetical protein